MRNRRSQGLVEYVGILIAIGLAVAGLMGVVTTQLGAKMNSLDLAGGGGGGGGGGGPVTYTITATNSAGEGSISPSGAVVVAAGGSQSFELSCIEFGRDFTVDGVSQGWAWVQYPQSTRTYTFTNVTADHTIDLSICLNPGA